MSKINGRLYLRLMSEINRHHDHHEAARTAINVAVLTCLRAVGEAETAAFLRDSADLLEAHAIAEVMQ
jgi:4-hydroxy-3-methylbut-2-en-1-yl diphosphate synthase IspG/GcpE